MASQGRNHDIAKLLEHFLDNNEDNLPPLMFKALDELAGEIDEQVGELIGEKFDLNDKITQLENELEELK